MTVSMLPQLLLKMLDTTGRPWTREELVGVEERNLPVLEEAMAQKLVDKHTVQGSHGRSVYALSATGRKAAMELHSLETEIKAMEEMLVKTKKQTSYAYEEAGMMDADVQRALQEHIALLHDYNEIKDVGQMLLGKLAEMEGTVTRELYERFELSLED